MRTPLLHVVEQGLHGDHLVCTHAEEEREGESFRNEEEKGIIRTMTLC